jgi:hypothetical protein
MKAYITQAMVILRVVMDGIGEFRPVSYLIKTMSGNYHQRSKGMNKEDRLYKLSQGSDTAVWAHDEIIKQDKRIAELEEALATSFEFLSTSQTADYRFYEDHKHLIKEKDE